MSLEDFVEIMLENQVKDETSKYQDGIYIAVSWDDESEKKIRRLQQMLDLEDPIEDLHTTIIYSKPAFDGEVPQHNKTFKTDGDFELDIFPHWEEEDQKVLVLKFKSAQLTELHNKFKEMYGFNHDYDEFLPHISLTYDYKGSGEEMTPEEIKEMLGTLETTDELTIEPLDEDIIKESLTEEEKEMVSDAKNGLLRKFMSKSEIKIANKLVKMGKLSKGKSDDSQGSVIYNQA